MQEARLPWTRLAAPTYQAMAAVGATLADTTLEPVLRELVVSRVSQINGCAFCVDMHTRDLRRHEVAWQRINSLSTWRETGFYDPRERAALHWAETLTRLADQHGDHDAAYAALRPLFGEQEIVELTWVIAQINTWNRMAVGMRQSPADKPLA